MSSSSAKGINSSSSADDDNEGAADAADAAALAASLAALEARFGPLLAARLVEEAPALLPSLAAADGGAAAWLDFLSPWVGDDDAAAWEILRHRHADLAATDVFNAGQAILFVKRLGWTDADVARRLLPVHARLLAAPPGALEAGVARLRALGLDEARVRELALLCPGLLYDEWGSEQLALAERAFERNRAKYSMMGSYEV